MSNRFGWRCDIEAAAAYILGPLLGRWLPCRDAPKLKLLTAIPLLLIETHNNYVRFHAVSTLISQSML
jgi:hypothetical protein